MTNKNFREKKIKAMPTKVVILSVFFSLFFIFLFLNSVSAEKFGYNFLEDNENFNPVRNLSFAWVNASQFWDTVDHGPLNRVANILGSWITNDLGWISSIAANSSFLQLNQNNWNNDPNNWITWEGEDTLTYNETKLNNTIDQKIASTYYNATNINTYSYTHDSGDINSISIRNDGDTYNVSEVGGTGGSIIINFTGVYAFDTLLLDMQYAGIHDMHIKVFDCDSGVYEEHGEISPNGFIFYSIDAPDSVDHICSGVVSVQLEHDENGNPSDDIYVDYANLVKGFSAGSNQEHDKLLNTEFDKSGHWGNLNLTDYNITADTFFGEEIYLLSSVGDEEIGGRIDMYRDAPEGLGHSYMGFNSYNVFKYEANSIVFNNKDVGGSVAIAENTAGNIIDFGSNWAQKNVQLRHYGYLTAPDDSKYVSFRLQDSDDWYWLERESNDIQGFKIDMPVDLVDNNITTTGNITADTYFGDGSQLTGAGNSSWNQSLADELYLKKSVGGRFTGYFEEVGLVTYWTEEFVS